MSKYKNLERFNKCFRCQGFNTELFSLSMDDLAVVFCGWCFDCQKGYSYRERVDTIQDKEERI